MIIFYLGYSLNEGAGGIENYSFTILNFLKSKGHTIIVHTINGKNDKFENVNFKSNQLLNKFFLGKMIGKRLRKKNEKIDLFLCGHLYLTNHMEKIVACYEKKYHLFVYGIDCWAGRFKKINRKLMFLDKVISISSFTTQQIKNQGFMGDIVYIPPVLNVLNFPKISSRKRFCDVIKFLTVGRLSAKEKYKGHDKVIEAMHILVNQERIKNIEYNIVGKGDDLDRLKKLVSKYKIEKYVNFCGYLSDEELVKVYSNSDVFIMPSNVSLNPRKPEGEGFGIVFIEAAMYELPLMGPNIGGSTDIIENKKNGLECSPFSATDISQKMKFLIEDKNKRMEFGKNAKEKVLSNFTLDQLEKYLHDILE